MLIQWKNGKGILGYSSAPPIVTSYAKRYAGTHTSTGALLLFWVMNTHCVHVIPDILHLWIAFIFNTVFTNRETSREVKWVSLFNPSQGTCRDLNPDSLDSESRLLNMTFLDKTFWELHLSTFIKIYFSPWKFLVHNQYISYVYSSVKTLHLFKSVKWLHHTLKWLI